MAFDPNNEILRRILVSQTKNKAETHPNHVLIDFYSLLYRHYPDAIFTLDKEGNLLDISDKVEDFVGYKPSELTGKNIIVLLEKDQEDLLNLFREYFALAVKGEPQIYNCKVIHKLGRTVFLSITFIPIKLNDEIVGVFGFVRNQTELIQKEIALTKLTNSLNLAQEIARLGSWDYDLDTNLVLCSDSLLDILGINSNRTMVTLYENLLNMLYSPEEQEYFDYHFQQLKRNGGKIELEYRVRILDETIITLQTTAQAIKDQSGRVIRIIGVARDVSKRVLTESKLRDSEEKYENIVNNIEIGIWSMNLNLRKIVYASPAVCKITGYNPEIFLRGEKSWGDLIHPDDRKKYLEYQSLLLNGRSIHRQYRIMTANGETKWIEDKTFPILDTEGNLIRLDGIIQDISERKQNEERIKYIANHDYLTELPNRRMFDQRLKELILTYKNEEDKFALFYLDIDRFKFLNDTLGHEIGDILLKEISIRLKTAAGVNSTFRLGGDEFAVILTNIYNKDPITFGQELRIVIEKPFRIEGYDINITTSVGVNIFPDDGDTLKELKMNSDVALYQAKELGKNNVQSFTRSLTNGSYQRFSLENDLWNAIRNDEFLLHYQPRFDTSSGEMVGAEALIRWIHPEKGMVSPATFIPLAEESELINEIGDWVMKTACNQLKKWQEQGKSVVPISINVSAKSLMKAELVRNMNKYLSEHAISPSLIEIEITEESLISNEGLGLSTIEKLRNMGFAIALDDFGTGYSSIGYLKKSKMDYLKIDRSFIKDIHQSAGDLKIVESIILLAEGFGLKVVAEGVEEKEQWEVLKKLNCHYIQGYLLSKPLPTEVFTNMLLVK